MMLKVLFSSIRSLFTKVRLQSLGKISGNLPFQDIEKRYVGRAANFQLEGWRRIHEEEGQLYRYTEYKDGEKKEKITREPTRKVYLANKGCIFSDKGIVYNPYYNCAVLETVEEWGNDVNDSSEYRKIKKMPGRYLPGLSFSLMNLGAVYNYAHFLFDSISRISLLQKLSLEPDWYLVSGPKQAWKEKVLDELNLLDKVVWINDHEEVQCEQLLFTNRLTFARHCTPFAANAIRNLFMDDLHNGNAPFRIVFASRNNARDRKTEMESELLGLLPGNVEVIDFEQLSMKETIQVCRESKLFIGFHGAAFANVVFCNERTKVVEFQVEEILPEWHRGYYEVVCSYLLFEHKIISIKEQMDKNDLKSIVNSLLSNGFS